MVQIPDADVSGARPCGARVSGRQAVCLLKGAGLSSRQARRLLNAGFAGSPEVTSGAHLYERDRILELAAWPTLAVSELDRLFLREVFIARRDLDVAAPLEAQLETLRDGWDLAFSTRAMLHVRCALHGFVPFVATVAGFVALGAEVTAVAFRPSSGTELALRDAGAWFDRVQGHRIASGPGREFVIRGWQLHGRRTWVDSRPEAG